MGSGMVEASSGFKSSLVRSTKRKPSWLDKHEVMSCSETMAWSTRYSPSRLPDWAHSTGEVDRSHVSLIQVDKAMSAISFSIMVMGILRGSELLDQLFIHHPRLRVRIQLLLVGFQCSEECCRLVLEGLGVALFRCQALQLIL